MGTSATVRLIEGVRLIRCPLNVRERAVSRYLSKFKVGNGHQIHLNTKKFKLLQVDMKNKSNTKLESRVVALLRKAQDPDNHWC